jgi:hypothetical protein
VLMPRRHRSRVAKVAAATNGWSSGSGYGSSFLVRGSGRGAAVDDLCTEVQQVGDSVGAAGVAVEGAAHGASGVRLVSEANGAVAAALDLHE